MMQGRGIAFPVVAFGGIALFGNGLKSIVSSSVLVSEEQFATFLRISPERTGLLMEGIMAAMVIALAVCPILLQRTSPRTLGIFASAIAAAAFAAFGLAEIAHPGSGCEKRWYSGASRWAPARWPASHPRRRH